VNRKQRAERGDFEVIESRATFELHNPRYTVRVWRTELELKDCYERQNLDIYNAARANHDLGPVAIIKAVAKLPRVSAVEVTNQFGNGLVVYPEWP
jgi:cell division septal protein FtsQ